jgi:hypothetical protein
MTASQIAPIVGINERNVRRHLRLSGIPDQRYEANRPQPEPVSEPLRPVRLTDVPIETRLEAADMLIEGGVVTGVEAREVLLAASWPSSQTY